MARSSRPIRAAPRTGLRPTFSPQTGLFYVGTARAFSVYYIFDPDLANPQGWGGTDRGGANLSSSVEAIDYKTGKIRWSHKWETPAGRSGLMSTAGNLVFTGDNSSNLVALNATTGRSAVAFKAHGAGFERSDLSTNSTDNSTSWSAAGNYALVVRHEEVVERRSTYLACLRASATAVGERCGWPADQGGKLPAIVE